VEISLSLSLPRDEQSIPVARHIVRHAMVEVGVDHACASDVEVALSEACTNVLRHSGPGDEYDVRLDLADEVCSIRVVDVGGGFDAGRPHEARAALDAEQGRGLGLMQALVDKVRFVSRSEAGTVVHLEKNLSYSDASLLGRHNRSRDSA
jgi:serine/threonine-protein kinase RsbW